MNRIRLKAHGKINLGLDVIRKREDGYHEVKMIMQTVGIFDSIDLIINNIHSTEHTIHITTNLSFLPTNENNLAYKVADMMMTKYNLHADLYISIRKFIPVSAGMAGGSTDAAAVMIGINKLFGLKLTQTELMEIALPFGADIPFCIMKGTALAEGIGEKLTKLPNAPDCCVILAKPAISVSTRFVYSNLHLDKDLEGNPIVHPNIDAVINSIKLADIHGIANNMGNILETVTATQYPQIEELKNYFMSNGAIGSIMSGSGPTVFGLFTDKDIAMNTYNTMKEQRMARHIYITQMCNE